MKRFSFALFASLVLMVSFSSCDKEDEVTILPAECTTATLQDYTGLDGCGFVIVIDHGFEETVLEPTNLTDFVPNPVDGQEVCIEYVERTDLASICMVGDIVEISTLEVLD